MKEAKVEDYLVASVEAKGGFCPKFKDPGRRGAPDRIVMLPGVPTLYVETKRPVGGELSDLQLEYHKLIRAAGQNVFVLVSMSEVEWFMMYVAKVFANG